MNYCIDTSIAVDILRGTDLKTSDRFSKISKAHGIYISCITVAELYKGAFLSEKQEENLQLVRDFVDSFEVLWIDGQACRGFGKQFAELHEKGKIVGEFDLLIAAIANSNGMKVITKNRKDFERIDVQTEVW